MAAFLALVGIGLWRLDWITGFSAGPNRAQSAPTNEGRRPAADWAAESFVISVPSPGPSASSSESAPGPTEVASLQAQLERISDKASMPSRGPTANLAPIRKAETDLQPDSVETTSGSEPEQPRAVEFDRKAASRALAQASASLGSCVDPAVGRISTEASVTFAPSGRVTQATLQAIPAMRGSPMVDCAVRRLREAVVPPFDGESRTVRTIVTIE